MWSTGERGCGSVCVGGGVGSVHGGVGHVAVATNRRTRCGGCDATCKRRQCPPRCAQEHQLHQRVHLRLQLLRLQQGARWGGRKAGSGPRGGRASARRTHAQPGACFHERPRPSIPPLCRTLLGAPQGKAAEGLRGAPYLLPLEEITRRTAEAWARGATEVCMQGGIHPDFTGARRAKKGRLRGARVCMHGAASACARPRPHSPSNTHPPCRR